MTEGRSCLEAMGASSPRGSGSLPDVGLWLGADGDHALDRNERALCDCRVNGDALVGALERTLARGGVLGGTG